MFGYKFVAIQFKSSFDIHLHNIIYYILCAG